MRYQPKKVTLFISIKSHTLLSYFRHLSETSYQVKIIIKLFSIKSCHVYLPYQSKRHLFISYSSIRCNVTRFISIKILQINILIKILKIISQYLIKKQTSLFFDLSFHFSRYLALPFVLPAFFAHLVF